jgi:hypothetical protein
MKYEHRSLLLTGGFIITVMTGYAIGFSTGHDRSQEAFRSDASRYAIACHATVDMGIDKLAQVAWTQVAKESGATDTTPFHPLELECAALDKLAKGEG